MTSGKRAALDRLYYPLLEATKALKTQGINLSVYDLLHYGVKGRSRFFVHVSAGIRVCPITNLTTNHDAQELKLLILSKLCCGEIECNREADESDFPSAYASLYSSSEYPQQHHNNNDRIERMYGRNIDANGMTQKIRITPQAICITSTAVQRGGGKPPSARRQGRRTAPKQDPARPTPLGRPARADMAPPLDSAPLLLGSSQR